MRTHLSLREQAIRQVCAAMPIPVGFWRPGRKPEQLWVNDLVASIHRCKPADLLGRPSANRRLAELVRRYSNKPGRELYRFERGGVVRWYELSFRRMGGVVVSAGVDVTEGVRLLALRGVVAGSIGKHEIVAEVVKRLSSLRGFPGSAQKQP